MLTPIRLSFFAAALVAGPLLAGCDAVSGPAPAAPAVSLQTQDAPAGDVLYDLAPLALGETFSITAAGPEGDVRLVTTRTADGYALELDRAAVADSPVEIRYLYDGREVAPSQTVEPGEPLLAGAADEGPDSWHYVCHDNVCVWEKDYKDNLTGPGGGTRFTTAAGDVVRVTHVAFVVEASADAAPSTVRFESPRAVAIRSQAFDLPVTSQAIR